MKRTADAEPVGYCQTCHEPLTRVDVLATGQARECRRCHQHTRQGRRLALDSISESERRVG
ncbi:MAG: hypothetical protein OWV35_07600 [Firmicutes bacterium]|nr:hypothetical protein [Bacillota bacterium]